MRKKFKILINLFVLFFIIFYPIKSDASSYRCDLFIKALINNYLPEFNYIPGDVYLNDFGYVRLQDWNEVDKKWYPRKDKNGNYIVGKIHRLDLAKHIKSGNSIISLNGQKFVYQFSTLFCSKRAQTMFSAFFSIEKTF